MADGSCPRKAVIAQVVQGQLDVAWLELTRNPERHASFPDAHPAESIQIDAENGRAGAFEQKLTVSTKSGYAKFLKSGR
ncbi:hypothetical protein METHB2_880010 [Candidatus Methylobacter favarea]|uniref:Uncharacterized protein n=1 Tax=Candidatus Methylobacter favarea TaxID=2707345 RepID=A0A8S0XLN2_9GAMM|nr:hypothetical protein METHB2_880010 [Candidatus Methylobacter favarea]